MRTARLRLALFACLALIPGAGYADEQRSRGQVPLKPPQSATKSQRKPTFQTTSEASAASALGDCDESSPAFKRAFSSRKKPGDPEPNSVEKPSCPAAGCRSNSYAVAQQHATSQP
jgi:hypothetical protein